MYGSDMGTLNVLVDGNSVWTRTGDQGNRWKRADITIQSTKHYKVKSLAPKHACRFLYDHTYTCISYIFLLMNTPSVAPRGIFRVKNSFKPQNFKLKCCRNIFGTLILMKTVPLIGLDKFLMPGVTTLRRLIPPVVYPVFCVNQILLYAFLTGLV
jgi:hypothetical protein